MWLSTMLRHRSGSSCFDKPATIFLVTNLSVKLPNQEYCPIIFNRNFLEDPHILDTRKQERITNKAIMMTRNILFLQEFMYLRFIIVKLLVSIKYKILLVNPSLFNRCLIKILNKVRDDCVDNWLLWPH